MAWPQVEQLLVLTLLLVSVRGWERISKSELLKFYETGRWREPAVNDDDLYDLSNYEDGLFEEAESVATSETSPELAVVDSKSFSAGETSNDDYDDYEDEVPDEAEGHATSELVNLLTNHLVEDKSGASHHPDAEKNNFHVEFVEVSPRTWIGCAGPNSEGIYVVCSQDGFQITLPPGQLSLIQVVGSKNISVEDAPESCGFHLNHLKNILTVGFTGCNVKEDVEDVYSLQLSLCVSGQTKEFVAFCVESTKFDTGPLPRFFSRRTKCDKKSTIPLAVTAKPSKCAHRMTPSPTSTDKPGTAKLGEWFDKQSMTKMDKPEPDSPVDSECKSGASELQKPHKCAVDIEEQIPCGNSRISPSSCEKRGCCVDFSTNHCYYPLDECTVDRHFVFAIRRDCARIPFDPRKLVIPGGDLCKPAIVNAEVAIFKVKLGDCGDRSYEVGGMNVHLIEVQTIINALNLKYGIITRTDPLRFMIECRYSKHGDAAVEMSLASVGYMVKTSSSNLPSSIISSGLYDVELKIAKNDAYSSYFPTYHQPLQLLLGRPVYLELNLRSPKPDAVILVNYCLAYPRSAKNALVLIHEGCANPNDPTVSILKVNGSPNNLHQRRFTVEAFQFMDQKTNMFLNEEIYFMCSAEVCIPAEKTCEERCFAGKDL
nr:zona pellucida sperm-binding protein 4 isoform X2 [Nothobranchius furzeri]